MPVSHIGLTVSHLPTSTSFFLAALAPLGYRYCGHSGKQIGLGIDEAELFLSQETESTKATSAHVAFLVPFRNLVDDFFFAALKAGGRIHGEPIERDPATGYYSAAVLDFDNNSIEVMHRGSKVLNIHGVDHDLEADRVLSWQREVAAGTVSQVPRSSKGSPRVVVTNITNPTVMVVDQTSPAKAGSDQNSKTLIGTLLGAAAGAAVAYAMSKGSEGANPIPGTRTYQAVGAARSQRAPSVINTGMSPLPTTISSRSGREAAMTECSRSRLSIASHAAHPERSFSPHRPTNRLSLAAPPTPAMQASTIIDTLAPPSEVPRYRDHPSSGSKADGANLSSSSRPLSDHLSCRTSLSRSGKIETRKDAEHSRHSSIATELRQNIHGSLPPLPSSHVSSGKSRLERRTTTDEFRESGDDGTVLESVAPSDSISQAGSKRSKRSRRASHRGRMGEQEGDEDGSQTSDKTIRAGKSKTGSRKWSILSLPVKPASRTSVHRSVVSFSPGM
ncbi:MAG: hypothetical protein Q9169_000649 [Polycauliona sp. 2 TL-2023]